MRNSGDSRSRSVRPKAFSKVPLSRPACSGFSLVELLITLALLIVMSVMLWGFGSPSNQQKQKRRCRENLQKLYLAMEIYARDFQGDFPFVSDATTPAGALHVLVPKYSVDTSIFICPGSKDAALPAGESIRNRHISYSYYMGRRADKGSEVLLSDEQVNAQSKALQTAVFSANGKAPGNNHHEFGGNFLFTDGRLETSSAVSPFDLSFGPKVVLLNPD
ncbi:MAG TPA: type II secretion system protein [Verrucomicrobiae bacterium]|nr:type II secretion system protein [Verrucomicrobiae bacterium]